MNTQLAAKMIELGLTQADVAEALNRASEEITGRVGTCSDRSVRRLLAGTTMWPQALTRTACEKVFGCTAADLGFVPSQHMTRVKKVRENVLRRDFLSTSGAALAVPTRGTPRRVGFSDLQRLQAEFDTLVAADDRDGGARLEARALTLADRTLQLGQDAVASGRVRSQIYQLAAGFTSTALFAAVDSKNHERAGQHVGQAIMLAGLSGDSAIGYRVWGHISMLALQQKNHPDALAAIAAAGRLSITRQNVLFASLGHARAAGIQAIAGNRQAALRSLGHADEAFARADHDVPRPSWMRFYDHAELAGLAGLTHYRLGQAAKAEACLHQTLTRLRPGLRRNRIYYTTYLALAQLGQGEIEQACHTASTIGAQVTGRAWALLREFTGTLTQVAGSSRTARAFLTTLPITTRSSS